MSRPVPSQGPGEGRRPLRVFRVEPGVEAIVRILSPVRSIVGIMTHWSKGRSLYCSPEGCAECRARSRRYWKGYLAALGWVEPSGCWLPIVLEVTESLELDMRGVIKRGQDWKLSRDREAKKQRQPVRGELRDQLDERELPRAFDFLPVLLNLYHELFMAVDVPNPMPGRVMVELAEGAPPTSAEQLDQGEAVPPGYLRDRLAAARKAGANGHAEKTKS
jgi:hypothetical protein